MPRQLNEYLIQDADKEGPYHPGTPVHDESKVTPLVDGESYFSDLLDSLNKLGNTGTGNPLEQGIYIIGWWIDPAFGFPVPDSDGDTRLIEILAKKKIQGVDVRVLAWANDWLYDDRWTLADLVVNTQVVHQSLSIGMVEIGFDAICVMNLLTVDELRGKQMDDSVMVNTLDHRMGSVHMKCAVLFDNDTVIGYTGGIDFVTNRIDQPPHVPPFGNDLWHDVQAKVEGRAAQALYDHFKELWNSLLIQPETRKFDLVIGDQILTINGKSGYEMPVPDKLFSGIPPYPVTHKVQSLRTIPRMDWPEYLPSEPPIFNAYEKGILEIQLGIKKAIACAEKYIYIEDQAFQSRYVFTMLKDAIISKPSLKLIMVTGINDPNDPPNHDDLYRDFSFHDKLWAWLDDQQRERIRFYIRPFVTMHSKVWLIDDIWALIGSANMTNRSLYIDIEHGVSFGDESNTVVRDFRIALWGEHFGLTPQPTSERERLIGDLEKALNIWKPAWGILGGGLKLPFDAEKYSELPGGVWNGIDHPIVAPVHKDSTPIVGTVMAENHDLAKITAPDLVSEWTEGALSSTVFINLMIRFSGGPNDGIVRIIVAHDGNTLTLNRKLPTACSLDGSSKFNLYMPRLLPISLPRPYLRSIPTDVDFANFISEYERFHDIGEHP